MKGIGYRKLNIIFMSLLLVFVCLISLGYSAINSELFISGNSVYKYTAGSLYERVRKDFSVSSKLVKKYDGDTSTFTGGYDVYYYYGEAHDNNVKFAGFCWKIIRTTDTGGVKIIYNGVPTEDGSCSNTGVNSSLTGEQMGMDSAFIKYDDAHANLGSTGYMFNKDLGYMSAGASVADATTYRYGNSFTYKDGSYTLVNTRDIANLSTRFLELNNYHYTCFNATGVCSELLYIFYYFNGLPYYIRLKNGKGITEALNETFRSSETNKDDSNIKKAVDYWYQNNMTAYTDYLEDTVWCNNREFASLGGFNPNGGSIENDFSGTLRFKSYADQSNLTCSNILDRFCVSCENGNKALKYPVALITTSEAALAYDSSNSNSFLKTGNFFVTMSPFGFEYYGSIIYYLDKNGNWNKNYYVNVADYNVRPVISLRYDIEYESGNGSEETPYVVAKPRKKLYDQIKDEASSNNFVKLYTGDRSTFKGNEDIYYYYGDASNNNVSFAGYCWKIVRTTDTGGVKLLYNGVPVADGSCINTGNDSILTAEQMGTSSVNVAFNSNNNSPADVGYMHNVRYQSNSIVIQELGSIKYGNSFTYKDGSYTLVNTRDIANFSSEYSTLKHYHYTCLNKGGVCSKIAFIYFADATSIYYIVLSEGKDANEAIREMLFADNVNTNDSTIKMAIDYWYQNNMLDYSSYLEDTVWCNNRRASDWAGWNSKEGNITDYLRFYAYSYKDDLSCATLTDRFTVESVNGNGALTYPVGLISEVERNLSVSNSKSPLVSGGSYWSISPTSYSTMSSHGSIINGSGDWDGSRVHYGMGVRPAISLRSGITYVEGDGGVFSPYKIK